MAKLKYTFTNDTLFKMLFVKYPALLKALVSELLSISLDSIGEFEITNPEMPPESLGEKFCRLDINMTVNGQRVDLEIQVADEGNYPERSLYYWAREYSSALLEGNNYSGLPRTVIISILSFPLFACDEYHSEFCAIEMTRNELLTDKMSLHYFELPKLPSQVSANDRLQLWLKLFKASTEEELNKIEASEVPEMKEAIGAYRSVSSTPEFRELERLRSKARHDEAQALRHAELKGKAEGEKQERTKWEGVVADKDAMLANRDALIAQLKARLEQRG